MDRVVALPLALGNENGVQIAILHVYAKWRVSNDHDVLTQLPSWIQVKSHKS